MSAQVRKQRGKSGIRNTEEKVTNNMQCLKKNDMKELAAGLEEAYDLEAVGDTLDEIFEDCDAKTKTTTKKKRKPSAYNLFISDCASKAGQGKPFKQCTIDWKDLSPEKKNSYKQKAMGG